MLIFLMGPKVEIIIEAGELDFWRGDRTIKKFANI